MQDLRWTGEDDDAECTGAGNNGGKKKKVKKSSKVMKSGIRAKAKARKDKFEAARQAAELEEEIEEFDDEEAMLLKHDCLRDIVLFLSFGFVGCVCVFRRTAARLLQGGLPALLKKPRGPESSTMTVTQCQSHDSGWKLLDRPIIIINNKLV